MATTLEADARTLELAGGADALRQIEAILAQSNGHSHNFRLVLDSGPDEQAAVQPQRSGPIYGHVSDDMAEQFSGGESGGKIWE